VLQASAFLDSLPDARRRAVVRGIARYAELTLVPFALQNVDGAQIARRMAGGETAILEPARARILAVLQQHGYPPTSIAASGLSPDLSAYGKGAAAYGGMELPGPALWFWTEAREDPRNANAATWGGVADSFERDLRTLRPQWLLEDGAPPTALASLLESCTTACSSWQSAALYRAAGKVAAAAWEDPDLDPDLRARGSDWPWREAIPAAMQGAFEAGLKEGSPRS
jgi:hypothetical protein